MRLGSLFSGYGGLDLAVSTVLPVTTAWVSDIEPGPQRILAHHWPDVPNLGDITAVDWAAVEPVDIIAGGSPCQDLSLAGQRAGMRPGTRSGLWESMLHAIATIRPSLVIWENVRGSLSAPAFSLLESREGHLGDAPGRPSLRALGRVLGDLASLGYDAQWCGLRAADVGACHGRFRVFVLAYAHNAGLQGQPDQAGAAPAGRHGHPVAGAGGPDLALLPTPSVADTQGGRKSRSGERNGELLLDGIAHANRWGEYAAAIARHERLTGRPSPAPTEPGPKGNPRLSAAFVEWMMGLPDGWVTGVPDLSRNAQLRALGNGVVPQQGAAAIRHLLGIVRAEVVA